MGVRDEAERLLTQAHRGIRRLLPEDAYLADAHTHLGLDEDGMTLDLETLLGLMRESGVKRALVFPLHEADRAPAYRKPNDRVLEWAAASGDRLVPLARLDLAEGAVEEGQRGLKLRAPGTQPPPPGA